MCRIRFQKANTRIFIESNRNTSSILSWGKSQKLGKHIEKVIMVMAMPQNSSYFLEWSIIEIQSHVSHSHNVLTRYMEQIVKV